jgi:triacylglycerol lipase
VGVWAARQGYVGVNLTYRLAPAHGWPAGSADLDRAINWLIDVIADYGGDPARIVLCGQSAGAVHVAGYLAGHGRGSDAPPPLAAAVLLSGIYDLTLMQDGPLHHAYYGTDRSSDAARSTLAALAALAVPLVELAREVAEAVTGNWIDESDPAVSSVFRAPIA